MASYEPSLINSLIPHPAECRMTGHDLCLPPPVYIYAPEIPEIMPVLRTFIDEIAPADGVPMKLAGQTEESHDLPGLFVEIEYSFQNPEAYILAVTKKNVRLRASSPAGLFYGLQTWLQLCQARSGEVTVTGADITDYPRFVWRGMHLDVSRHFFPVSFIKKYIDLLARHKMNIFHWHLCDDQGWRIEIPEFSRLTEIGAWRDGESGRYGGFYCQDEISEIVDYAKKRCVTIVPEIEMPGHAMAALAAYPEYSCTGGPFEVPAAWGVFEDVYCAGNKQTFVFLEKILSDVASLFPGQMIHIGGDECPKARWHEHTLCQELMGTEGLLNEDQLQAYFIARIAKHLESLRKRLIGWDEILDGGAPDRSVIMAWRGMEKGLQAALSGHDVVMCPMSHCYFDHYQADPDGEPKAIGGFSPLDKVYSFEPVPEEIPENLRCRILGAQGNVWTEYMLDSCHVEYMTFPRLCALAEVLWSRKAVRSWEDFRARLDRHLNRLDRLGVNYRRD